MTDHELTVTDWPALWVDLPQHDLTPGQALTLVGLGRAYDGAPAGQRDPEGDRYVTAEQVAEAIGLKVATVAANLRHLAAKTSSVTTHYYLGAPPASGKAPQARVGYAPPSIVTDLSARSDLEGAVIAAWVVDNAATSAALTDAGMSDTEHLIEVLTGHGIRLVRLDDADVAEVVDELEAEIAHADADAT